MNTEVTVMNFKQNNPLNPGVQGTDSDRPSETWSLNFATSPGDECEMPFVKKPKTIRDPLSHRIIEKRRRDRMNNCLADLSRLIPTNYMKQGQGRIEKTEIIEMAIKHINNLTSIVTKQGALKSSLPDRYLGFKECQDEVMRYLVEVEEWDVHDKLCSSLMAHLEQAGEKFRIMNDGSLSQAAKEEQYRHIEEDTEQHTMPMAEAGGSKTLLEFPRNPLPTAPVFSGPMPVASPVPASPKVGIGDPPMPCGAVNQFNGLDALASAQQITQEQLKHDKHLWTLLTNRYDSSSGMEDSGIATPSITTNKTASSRASSKTDESHLNHLYKVPQEPVSSYNSYNNTVAMDSSKNDLNAYKFKHNITKRFSQEGKKVMTSDSSSISSGSQENKSKVKRKIRHVRARSPSSLSTNYPNSDSSNNNGSSSNSNGEQSGFLPSFVLHPTGTYYVPLSIHPSDIVSEFFEKDTSVERKVFHPISIPVYFGGPLLYVKRVTDWKTESTGTSVGSGDSPGVSSSVENLSGCNSENSPNPEQETK